MSQPGKNHEITIGERQGSRVHATVKLQRTIPPGGITLAVVYDKSTGKVVSVDPWRNLGEFVLADLAAKA